MIGKLLLAGTITVAAVSSLVVAARERQFAMGSPLIGVFAPAEDAHDCDAAPREQLIGFTPTDLYIFEHPEWWHGRRVRHRTIFFAWERPGLLIRAETRSGEAIELVIERKRDGFELVGEEVALANGDRVKRPRRADRPNFFPCPEGTTEPWLAPSKPKQDG